MKIALIGYGRMGQQIHSLAANHQVIIIDPHHSDANFTEINSDSLQGVDVAIDFTHPDTALSNLEAVAATGTNLVMGTTGWYDQVDQAKAIVEKSGIGFIYSPNYAIGVNLFWKIVAAAAKDFAKFNEYDVFGHEFHHTAKADSPSGTAIIAAEKVLENTPNKNQISYETSHGPIDPTTLHFSSTRGGKVPGTHSIFFDSEADTVEITHNSRSRQGFASGALRCAEWLQDKTGFYAFDDYLNSLL